jgi:hypothetical protein
MAVELKKCGCGGLIAGYDRSLIAKIGNECNRVVFPCLECGMIRDERNDIVYHNNEPVYFKPIFIAGGKEIS